LQHGLKFLNKEILNQARDFVKICYNFFWLDPYTIFRKMSRIFCDFFATICDTKDTNKDDLFLYLL